VTSVAVIGVGLMGTPISRSLQRAGFELTVCDVNEAALAPFAADGVRTVNAAKDCADVDVVLVLVMTVAQMRDVLLGENGIAAGVKGGRSPLVLIMCTVGRTAASAVAQDLAERGIRAVDSPISGGAVRAAAGTLSVMVGGDPADIEVATPVLRAVGSEILQCGPVGSAQLIKVLNNVIGGINTLLVAETYRIALENGMSAQQITDVLEASTGRNWLSKDAAEVTGSFQRFTAERRTFDGLITLMHKDFDTANELLDEVGASYPVIRGVTRVLDGLGDESYDNWRAAGGATVA
jgi:3-hydroxyisobutyrate dehydrogenase